METIQNQTVLITGGSRGLGLGIAEAFLRRQAKVTVLARDSEGLGAIERLGAKAVQGDATDAALMDRLVTDLRPKALILNAGATPWMGSIEEQTFESFSIVWNNDVKATLHGIQAALKAPMPKGGRVLLASSGAALVLSLPAIRPEGMRLSGGYMGAKRMIWLMAHNANSVARTRELDLHFQVLLPLQLVGATGLGRAVAMAYAEREGTTVEDHLARYGAPLLPEQYGEDVATLLSDPRYADGVAYGFRRDTPIASLDAWSPPLTRSAFMPDEPTNRDDFDTLLGTLRPRLHRYCARMTGSVIDGEDVVQDTLLNAYEARSTAGAIANVEAWLFRIAHNAAMDFLRRHARAGTPVLLEIDETIAAPGDGEQDREIAAASLHTFMRLAPPQRCAVILKDVLGYSVEEVGEVMETSVPAAKSALQRGRARLRELGGEREQPAGPVLAEPERSRLTRYVACFNARDFDTLRAMLADDVQLDLVNRLRVKGRDKVGEYLHRYALAQQWRFEAACVDGRPVMVVFDRNDPAGGPAYFVALDFAGDAVTGIRDFLFARYVLDGAELRTL